MQDILSGTAWKKFMIFVMVKSPWSPKNTFIRDACATFASFLVVSISRLLYTTFCLSGEVIVLLVGTRMEFVGLMPAIWLFLV